MDKCENIVYMNFKLEKLYKHASKPYIEKMCQINQNDERMVMKECDRLTTTCKHFNYGSDT